MNWNYCLIVILVLAIFPTFKNINAAFWKTDGKTQAELLAQMNAPTKGEVFINDNSFSGDGKHSITVSGENNETTVTAEDGSQIRTTYDLFGNKTEIRTFFNNPRLTRVLLRTSVEDERQIYVYGQNGEVEPLPQNMLDRAMIASGDEIAAAAGITSVKQQRMTPAFQEIKQLPTIEINPLQGQNPNQITVNPQEETQTTTEKTEEAAVSTDKNLGSKETKDSINKP